MRLPGILFLAFLPVVTLQASAKEPHPTAPHTCPTPEVILRENEPVLAPPGTNQVFFFNAESMKMKGPLGLMQGPPLTFIPSARSLVTAGKLKEQGFRLRWGNSSDPSVGCLQDFSIDAPVRVQLDETGVENRFVNPVNPVGIDDRPLEFVNNTGDRTFKVTIPFVYSAVELGSAYAVADETRGNNVLSEIIRKALDRNGGGSLDEQTIRYIDTFEGLRTLLIEVSKAKATSLEGNCEAKDKGDQLGDHVKNGGCAVEILFWTAACQIEKRHNQDVAANFARSGGNEDDLKNEITEEAPQFLAKVFNDSPSTWPPCTFSEAKALQKESICKLEPSNNKPDDCPTEPPAKKAASPETPPPVDSLTARAKSEGLKARFADARVEMTKKILKEAIREKMGYPRTPTAPPPVQNEIKKSVDEIFKKLEDARHRLLQKTEIEEATLLCKLREVEAAGKLLASYSPDSDAPYQGVPSSLTSPTNESCEALANPKGETRAPMSRVREFRDQRNAEQGIEITDCESDGTSTSCSATATIPPYQRATFSRSVLAHHPKPRIRFTVSFFGDTEVPANANGYVTRGDAAKSDEKPKSQFGVQLGGDTSLSMNPDDAITGELRHTGATGSLSFQYTGPVEASATVQFKKGDFGGVSSSNQLQASQYQAKVYGPGGVVLQYGRIPFAQPSSGIAINIFGEGAQVIVGRATLGYVVLRESEAGTANRQNKDSDLWLFQIRNEPLTMPFLRSFDIVAVYGKDRNDKADSPPVPRPFIYRSFGSEVRWGTERFPSLGGSFAAYHSVRSFHSLSGMDLTNPTISGGNFMDGRGTVGLARITWSHLLDPKLTDHQSEVRQAFGLSGFLGYGTGNRKETPRIDEGYLGENANYSNDMLFLSRVASSKTFSDKLGGGLSNKSYLGIQYTDARFSPLELITRGIGAEKDIESRSTVLALHSYWFNHQVQDQVQDRSWAGMEADLTFNVEAPKNIQWVLGGAYYRKSEALGLLGLKNDLWSVTAKLSIKLNSL